jgi:hypothetical protein
MRKLSTLFLSSLLMISHQQLSFAEDVLKPILTQNVDSLRSPLKFTPTGDFWQQAKSLIQEQIYFVNRTETGLALTLDSKRIESSLAQLFFYEGKLERFLNSQYNNPNILCSSINNNLSVTNTNLSQEQAQVYCALLATSKQLPILKKALENRLARATDVTPINPLFSNNKTVTIPQLPEEDITVLFGRTKTAIANYKPVIKPAFAPSETTIITIKSLRDLLTKAINYFPEQTQAKFIYPNQDTLIVEKNTFNPYPQEITQYASFLAQPQTGITVFLPKEVYKSYLDDQKNRYIPKITELYPFPALNHKNGFTSRLAVRINQGNFQIVTEDLDYGLIGDLGDIPLENLEVKKHILGSNLSYIFNYNPPNTLESLQLQRRKLLTGKIDDVNYKENGFMQAPVQLNHTYVVRLIQFKLPEVIKNGGVVKRSDRGKIDQLLHIESSDILVAFRPVYQRSNGGYTVLWKILGKFANPQISDLEKYLYLE